MCKITSKEAQAIVKGGKEISCEFIIKKSLRHGDAITPVI
jgi:hypothetical protein